MWPRCAQTTVSYINKTTREWVRATGIFWLCFQFVERVVMVPTANESVSVTTEGSAFLQPEPVNVQQDLSGHAATSVSPSQTLINKWFDCYGVRWELCVRFCGDSVSSRALWRGLCPDVAVWRWSTEWPGHRSVWVLSWTHRRWL